MPDYSPIYYVTDAGVYVIRNMAGISIDVNKLWFDRDTKEAFVPGSDWPPVTFDVYRTLNQDYIGEYTA